MIRVVNKRKHTPSSNDVYIGRGSVLGNPYTSKQLSKTKAQFQCSCREESVAAYEAYILEELRKKNPAVRKALNDIYLKAKAGDVNLVCFCAPLLCHGDVIKRLVEQHL